MSESLTVSGTLLMYVQGVNSNLCKAVRELDEETFHERAGRAAPSIAFHLWHTARWADLFQARTPTFSESLARLGTREQVWIRLDLAGAWGLPDELGADETGMGLDEDASASLPLPDRHEVMGYAQAAFAAAEEVFASVMDGELLDPTGNLYDEEGWFVLDHFAWYAGHSNRHLGMMEALKGAFGLPGTVTI